MNGTQVRSGGEGMVPKYIRLAETLREQIKDCEKSSSYKLPTERQLCERYGVSRQTVRQALSVLKKENLIDTRHGSGSYIKGHIASPLLKNVAIVISSDSEYIYPSLLADIKATLNKAGFMSKVYVTENEVSKERDILEKLLEQPLRGLICEGVKTVLPNPNQDLYEDLYAKGVSVLFVNGSYDNFSNTVCIESDDVGGGYQLGEYLIKQGHVNIAGIFKSDDRQGTNRYYGWRKALCDFKINCPEQNIAWFSNIELNNLQKNQDIRFLLKAINKNIKSCTAVVCHNDEIAYWLIKELEHMRINVPEDISVVSFDNSYLCTLGSVLITSLSHKPHELGTTAAKSLIKMMQGIEVSSQMISWHLDIKKSAARRNILV